MAYMGMFMPQIVAQNMVDGANSFVLLAIPFFILAGELMNAGAFPSASSICHHLCRAISAAVWLRGIVAALIMAALSGSAAADNRALAAILVPMMSKAGYNVPRSAGPDRSRRHYRAGDPAPSIAFISLASPPMCPHPAVPCRLVPGIMMAVALLIAWPLFRGAMAWKSLPKATGPHAAGPPRVPVGP